MAKRGVQASYSGYTEVLGGVPMLPGGLPLSMPYNQGSQYYGKHYFVGKGGDDGADGSTWGRRVLTIDAALVLSNADIASAWDEAPWAPNNVIVIAPGKYAENITTAPYGVNLIGLGDSYDQDGERGVKIIPASGSPFTVGSTINSRIQNIRFQSPDTASAFKTDTLNNCVIENCVFAGNTSDTTVNVFETTHDVTNNRFNNNVWHRGDYGLYIDVAAPHQFTGNIFDHGFITGCTTAGFHVVTGSVPSFTVVNDFIIGDGTTLANGISDPDATIAFYNCMITATACDPASGAGYYNHCYLNGSLMT